MPADEDYGRRQITIQQHLQRGTPSPVQGVQCPAGCIPSPAEHRLQQDHRNYVSEKSLLPSSSSERFVADRGGTERYAERYGGERAAQERFASERAPASDRFGSERSNSDRLPSGERYQGVSERYPLGDRPQTSVSSERLAKDILQSSGHCQGDPQNFQSERFQYTDRTNCQRYPERYTPVQNVGSLDRYHTHTLDRYSRTNTPTERYHTLSTTDKDRCGGNSTTTGRYTPTEKYHCSMERYTPTERHRANSKPDIYKAARERSASSERKGERFQQYQNNFNNERDFGQERFPTIPCPERFATQERPERIQYAQQSSYLEPPSPAPASDRFIPPPPLSPENTPSPDCFPNNTFPSPINSIPINDRFIPPPPLSPSPTEAYSPKKQHDRYDKQPRYQNRYVTSPNPNDRYQSHDRRINNGSIHQNSSHSRVNNADKYNGERYVPPHAHVPVERYVPQPQEQYYQQQYQTFDRFKIGTSSDPYMRRDLIFQFRLPYQYQRIRYVGTPSRMKCCQYQEEYQLTKSSPGSSSNSSVTSQGKELHQKDVQCVNKLSLQDLQCQNYQGKEQYQCGYQQEKGTQCGALVVSPNLRSIKGQQQQQCRHSICGSPGVEYVGGAGGRHVCATPPPRGSLSSAEGSVCNDTCCTKRLQPAVAVAIWRNSPPQIQNVPQQQQQQPQPQTQQAESQTPPQTAARSVTPVNNDAQKPTASNQQTPEQPTVTATPSPAQVVVATAKQPTSSSGPKPQRSVSMPAEATPERQRPVQRVNYTQSERLPNRPTLTRSLSRKEAIKNYLKKETAHFFGVDEENEQDEQLKWLDRRKRMASRTLGPLKEEYQTSTIGSHRRTMSDMAGTPMSGQLVAERPDVLPGPSDMPDGQERLNEVTVRRKDSVARMTWDGIAYVVTTLARQRPRPRTQQTNMSRSYPPGTPSTPSSPEEQTFFDNQPSKVPSPPPTLQVAITDEVDDTVDHHQEDSSLQPPYRDNRFSRQPHGGWRRDHDDVVLRQGEDRPRVGGGSRILSSMLDHVLDNSDRRQYGMGWVGKMFGRSMRKSVAQDFKIQQQLDDLEDHRPMFTYWVTTVQILVLFISLLCYGLGPFGINFQSRSGQVLVTSLSLQQVEYMEPANFWIGPRAGDLIHLGAKFGPCMRLDDKVSKQIDKIKARERETACCIRNDDSGCVQSTQSDCSKIISTWKKWTVGESGPGGRISGSVCGLDPKFCDAPASVHPYEWPDDITKWPICRKTNTQFSIQKKLAPKDKVAEHMVCEVIGHPCCIGIHGQCKITTREYCDFVKGTFHEEASLCSQVSCLNDVCGMLPFYFPDMPDQFYRLWTSIFLHAGLIQLSITVIIQWFLMRDLEKLTGSLRIGIIYIGSGVVGNLASAIFVPYRADVGPAGSQFGLLACLIVEVLNAWPMLKYPHKALSKLLSVTGFLFIIGLLPWVDNYAHLFGFVFGFLLSYAFLPFISFGEYDRQKKIFLIWVCLLSAAILFICLVLFFYIIPIYDCKICSYFNCIPFTRDFCASQNINFKNDDMV